MNTHEIWAQTAHYYRICGHERAQAKVYPSRSEPQDSTDHYTFLFIMHVEYTGSIRFNTAQCEPSYLDV